MAVYETHPTISHMYSKFPTQQWYSTSLLAKEPNLESTPPDDWFENTRKMESEETQEPNSMTCTPKEPASLPGAGGAGKRSVCGGLAALPSLGIHHRPFPIIDFLCSVGGGGTSHPLQIIGRINVNGKSNLRLFLNDGRKRNNRVRTYIYAGKTSYQNWVKSRYIRIAYNFR